jgi:hypothetical protein
VGTALQLRSTPEFQNARNPEGPRVSRILGGRRECTDAAREESVIAAAFRRSLASGVKVVAKRGY